MTAIAHRFGPYGGQYVRTGVRDEVIEEEEKLHA